MAREAPVSNVSLSLVSGPGMSPRVAALFGAASIVAAGTATAKVAALLKDVVVAAHYGNGVEMDAFLLALALPTFFVNVAAGTLQAALTPAYVAAREQHGIEHARTVAGQSLRTLYIALAALAIIVAPAALLFQGAPTPSRASFVLMAFALAPFTVLQGASAAWTALLAAERRYLIGALAPVLQPGLMVLVVLATASTLGAYALVAGLLAGTLVQAMLLAFALTRRGIPLARRGAMPSAVRSEYLPAAAGALVMSASPLIDQAMAAPLGAGSVSALNYGGKIVAVVMTIGAMSLSTTLLPLFSEHVAKRAWTDLRRILRVVPLLVAGLLVPCTALLLAFSPELIARLFQRGAFTAEDAVLVSAVQRMLLLQLPVHLLGIVYVRLLSALRANRVLFVGSCVSATVNVVGNLLLAPRLGVVGIALSTSVVYLLSCVYLGWSVHKRLNRCEADAPHDLTRNSARRPEEAA